MTFRFSTLGLFTSFCLIACGHGAATEPAHSPASEQSSGSRPASFSGRGPAPGIAAPARGGADKATASAQESAAPSAGAAYPSTRDAELARPPESRPGLGTSWGEAVRSRVSTTSFTRARSDSPDVTASLFYNDEEGVEATSVGRFVDWGDSVVPLAGGSVTVSLVDTRGRPLRAARVDGRTIAVGSDGDRYVVRVDNHTQFRIETVATVDGLDVVDGSDGDVRKRGYIIAPYDTLEIEGFRESQGSVRAFRFGSVSDAYASRRGKDRNVGVVGVALFAERGSDYRWTPEETTRRSFADPFPSHFAPAPPAREQWRAE
jgi:hypothetical protein